jgi:hypothetical protein
MAKAGPNRAKSPRNNPIVNKYPPHGWSSFVASQTAPDEAKDMKHFDVDPAMTARACDIVLRERSMSLSEREWKFRLRGYGYAIRDTEEGPIITSLLKGDAICALPDPQSADSEPRYAA